MGWGNWVVRKFSLRIVCQNPGCLSLVIIELLMLSFEARDLKGIRQWAINLCMSPMMTNKISFFMKIKIIG